MKTPPRKKETPTSQTQRLTQKLQTVGVRAEVIDQLLGNYPPQRIETQLSYLPFRHAQNPAGLLVRAIKDNWSPPAAYRNQTPLKTQQTPDAKAKGKTASHANEEAAQKQRHQKLETLGRQLSAAERHALRTEAQQRVRRRLGKSWPTGKPIPKTFINAEFHVLLEAKVLKTSSQPKPPTPEPLEPIDPIR